MKVPNIKITIDYNIEDIKSIFFEYWSNVSLDLVDFDKYLPDTDSVWYKIEIDGELAGYFSLEDYGVSEDIKSIHVCIKGQYRPLKKLIVLEFKKYIKNTLPENIDYIIALIPKRLTKTVVFAVENDFDFLETIESDIGKIIIMGIPLNRFLEEVVD